MAVKQLDYDLTPVAGLALVGHHLNALQPLFAREDSVFKRPFSFPYGTLNTAPGALESVFAGR